MSVITLYAWHANPDTLFGYDQPCCITESIVCSEWERDVHVAYIRHGVHEREDGPACILFKLSDEEVHRVILKWYHHGIKIAMCSLEKDGPLQYEMQWKGGQSPTNGWTLNLPVPTLESCLASIAPHMPAEWSDDV